MQSLTAASSLLIDTNLLVLLVVGRVNPERIQSFKRTSGYDKQAYDALERIVLHARRLVALPHVWAEVSNLTDLGQFLR